MSKKLNIRKLVADIHAIEAEIKEVKTPLRRTWPADDSKMWRLQVKLSSLKWQATKLYAIRAGHRGKVHMPGQHTFEEQQDWLKSEREKYALGGVQD